MKPLNQFLHEDVMGLCWHETFNSGGGKEACKKCGACEYYPLIYGITKNPSYSDSWQDYGKLITHCKKQLWWGKFTKHMQAKWHKAMPWVLSIMLDTQRGSEEIARFMGWEG